MRSVYFPQELYTSRIQRCIPLAAKKPVFVPGQSVPTLLDRMQAILVLRLVDERVYRRCQTEGERTMTKRS